MSGRVACAVALALLGLGAVQAQGMYDSEDIDENWYLYADIYGYSGPNNCGSWFLQTSFDGNYQSGWAPTWLDNTTTFVPGAGHDWESDLYGEILQPDGSCLYLDIKIKIALDGGYRQTWWQNVTQFPNGSCQWIDLACDSGNPTCNEGSLLLSIIPPPFPPCPSVVQALYPWLSVNGNVTNFCLAAKYGGTWDGVSTRYCT